MLTGTVTGSHTFAQSGNTVAITAGQAVVQLMDCEAGLAAGWQIAPGQGFDPGYGGPVVPGRWMTSSPPPNNSLPPGFPPIFYTNDQVETQLALGWRIVRPMLP
jgi:hypothetical protein